MGIIPQTPLPELWETGDMFVISGMSFLSETGHHVEQGSVLLVGPASHSLQ